MSWFQRIREWRRKRKFIEDLDKAIKELKRVAEHYQKTVIKNSALPKKTRKEINKRLAKVLVLIAGIEENLGLLTEVTEGIEEKQTFVRSGRKHTLFHKDLFLAENARKYLDNCTETVELVYKLNNSYISSRKANNIKKDLGRTIAFLQHVKSGARNIISMRRPSQQT